MIFTNDSSPWCFVFLVSTIFSHCFFSFLFFFSSCLWILSPQSQIQEEIQKLKEELRAISNSSDTDSQARSIWKPFGKKKRTLNRTNSKWRVFFLSFFLARTAFIFTLFLIIHCYYWERKKEGCNTKCTKIQSTLEIWINTILFFFFTLYNFLLTKKLPQWKIFNFFLQTILFCKAEFRAFKLFFFFGPFIFYCHKLDKRFLPKNILPTKIAIPNARINPINKR